eukprot:TRINITY_DN24832_c0_g1_i1.p1 TRINITY_DN24832_c0_g1~~TRINITY_DN24832_c0_g1_i1.p1  ORF type:complete len:478 (-),score=97.52 TRINITY_DN24832_c0_g1_i1:851-2284(-)
MLRPPSPKTRRRPPQLRDEHFLPPVLLGNTHHGHVLRVKNTFLDVPSGLTPTSMKYAKGTSGMRSAPAAAGLEEAGFVKQALLDAVRPQEDQLSTPSTVDQLDYSQTMTDTSARVGEPLRGSTMRTPARTAGEGEDGRVVISIQVPTSEDCRADSDCSSEDEDDVERTAVNAPAPPPGAAHPSIGSELHGTDNCKRCCFFPRGRCLHGYLCEFCHYEHEKRKRKSKKKKNKSGATGAAQAEAPVTELSLAAVAVDAQWDDEDAAAQTCAGNVSVEQLADAVATGGLGMEAVQAEAPGPVSPSPFVGSGWGTADAHFVQATSATLSTTPAWPASYGGDGCFSLPNNLFRQEAASYSDMAYQTGFDGYDLDAGVPASNPSVLPQVFSLEPAVFRPPVWPQTALEAPAFHSHLPLPQHPAASWEVAWQPAEALPGVGKCIVGEATPPPPADSPKLPSGIDSFFIPEGPIVPTQTQLPIWS